MPPEPKVIETERLRLEPARASHGEPLAAAIEDTLPELRKWMSWAWEWDRDESLAHVRDSEERWKTGDGWEFVIVHDGTPAGTIGLNRYDPMWRSCNLGYWIRTDLAGRGLVTEGARAVVDFAFTQAGLTRLELVAEPSNVASWRVAEKLGFQREGTKRGGSWAGGRQVDVYLYGLLATDPRPASG